MHEMIIKSTVAASSDAVSLPTGQAGLSNGSIWQERIRKQSYLIIPVALYV